MSSAEGVERRRYARQRVHALAYVELGQDNGGIMLNVSEGGLAVAAATPLTGDALPRIRFRLPGSASWIETGARIAWIADTRREAGVVFLDLPAIDRTRIKLWIVAPEPVVPASPSRLRELTPSAAAPEVSLAPERPAEPPPEPPLELKPAATPISIDRGAPAAAAPLPEVVAARLGESWLRPEPKPPTRRWLPLVGLGVACVLVAFFVGIMAGRGSWKGLRVEISHLIALPASSNPAAPSSASTDAEPPNVPAASGSSSASNTAPSPPAAPPASAALPPEPSATAASPAALAPSAQPSAPSSGAQPALSRPDQTAALATAPQSLPQNPAASSAPSAVAPALPTAPSVAAAPAPAAPTAPAAAPPPGPVANPTGTVSVLTDVYPSIRLTAATSASRSMPLQLGALTSRVEPVYPVEALRRGVQGTVMLHILIGTDGTVTETQVVSGPQALIEAARDAVGRWRYQPTLLGNQRVETEADATITFRLTTPPASPPASSAAPAPAP